MRNKNLGTILLSGLLTFATAPITFSQTSQGNTSTSPSQAGPQTQTPSTRGENQSGTVNSQTDRQKPSDMTTPGADATTPKLDQTPEQQQQQDHPEKQPDQNQVYPGTVQPDQQNAPIEQAPYDPSTSGPSAPQSDHDSYADLNSSGKVAHEYQQRATKAAEVLRALTASSDNRIPDTLLSRADAIAVIPSMVKGAFGIGGTYGKGLVSQRLDNGRWSAPAFISIGGGSYGLQLGANATDLVLVFTNRAALDSLQSGMSLKLGVDVGVTAGPIGREGEAAISQNARGGIFAYSRSRGLFAGVALSGDVISIDKTANRKVYGANVDTDQILTSSALASNVNVRPFVDALNNVVSMRRTTR